MITGLVTTSVFAHEHGSTARAARDAIMRAVKDLAADPGLSAELVAGAAGADGPIPAGMHLPRFATSFSAGDLQRAFDLAFGHGLAPRPLDAANVVCELG